MKIYTYYEDIEFKQQNELLELWESSWKRNRFEPIILGIEHAARHPYYAEFCEHMRYIYNRITDKELSRYGLSCFTRWLAYATQTKSYDSLAPQDDEYFFVSDYDVINRRWYITDPVPKNMHLYDSACPCFVSGTAKQFESLCYTFYELTMERIDHLIQYDHYHDQEFFQYNFIEKYNSECKKVCDLYNIQLTRDHARHVAPYLLESTHQPKAFHVSHSNTHHIMDQQPDRFDGMNLDQARIHIIKNIP